MSTTAPNVRQDTKSPQSKPKRAWELIALMAVVAVLIVGELAFQWAKHRGWTTCATDDRQGCFFLSSFAETPDGAVWLVVGRREEGKTIRSGVSRFDGQTWTTYTADDGLADNNVRSITVAPDGALWFATNGGVSHFDGQTWTSYTAADGLASDTVERIAVAPDGTVCVATSDSGVSCFDGETWTSYTKEDGLADNDVGSIAVAPDGAFWFRSSPKSEGGGKYVGNGVSRFDGETWTTYTADDGLADNTVWGMTVAPDGALLFCTKGASERRAVSRFDGETWTTYVRNNVICSPVVAPDGAEWYKGRYSLGVYRYDGNTRTSYWAGSGLADSSIAHIAVAPDGAVWVGTRRGVSRFDRGTWATYTAANSGLAKGTVSPIAFDRQGRVWMEPGDGLNILDERVSLSAQTLQTWATVWDGVRILGVIALLVLLEIWIVRRDREARKEMLPAAARPVSAKLPSIGLGALGSLAGLALLTFWRGPGLNEAVGEGMIMMLLIGPVLAVVCIVLGAVAGWVSARMASSKWGALIAGAVVGLFAASVTYLLMMATFV